MSVLFAYPGQGAQRPGMLAALPDEPPVRACLEQAADCLGQAPAELESAEALRGGLGGETIFLRKFSMRWLRKWWRRGGRRSGA